MEEVTQAKREEFKQAHEQAKKQLVLGIDWEIKEEEAKLADERSYLDILLEIKDEAFQNADMEF